MDDTTQHNAALVEEAAAAAQALQEQAYGLNQVVSVFKLEAAGVGLPVATGAVARPNKSMANNYPKVESNLGLLNRITS